MPIRDFNMDWLVRTHRIPYQSFCWNATHVHTGTSTSGAHDVESLRAISGNIGAITQISNFGVAGVSLTQADILSAVDVFTPTVADWEEPIGARVLYTLNTATPTAGAYVTFTVSYRQFDQGAAMAAPTVALDTVITRATPGVTSGYRLHVTPRGQIRGNRFDNNFRFGGLLWRVAATTVSGVAAGVPLLLGLEIDYKPRLCVSPDEAFDLYSLRSAS